MNCLQLDFFVQNVLLNPTKIQMQYFKISRESPAKGMRTGVMVDHGGVSSSKVSNFQGIMDVLEDDSTEIIMLKQYLDLLASAGSTRFAMIVCKCVFLVIVC